MDNANFLFYPQPPLFLIFVSMFLTLEASTGAACNGAIVAKSPFNVAKSPLVLQKVRSIHRLFSLYFHSSIVAKSPLLLQVDTVQ
jgi:hypothetical protein